MLIDDLFHSQLSIMDKAFYQKFRCCQEASWQSSFLEQTRTQLKSKELLRLESTLDRFAQYIALKTPILHSTFLLQIEYIAICARHKRQGIRCEAGSDEITIERIQEVLQNPYAPTLTFFQHSTLIYIFFKASLRLASRRRNTNKPYIHILKYLIENLPHFQSARYKRLAMQVHALSICYLCDHGLIHQARLTLVRVIQEFITLLVNFGRKRAARASLRMVVACCGVVCEELGGVGLSAEMLTVSKSMMKLGCHLSQKQSKWLQIIHDHHLANSQNRQIELDCLQILLNIFTKPPQLPQRLPQVTSRFMRNMFNPAYQHMVKNIVGTTYTNTNHIEDNVGLTNGFIFQRQAKDKVRRKKKNAVCQLQAIQVQTFKLKVLKNDIAKKLRTQSPLYTIPVQYTKLNKINQAQRNTDSQTNFDVTQNTQNKSRTKSLKQIVLKHSRHFPLLKFRKQMTENKLKPPLFRLTPMKSEMINKFYLNLNYQQKQKLQPKRVLKSKSIDLGKYMHRLAGSVKKKSVVEIVKAETLKQF